MAPRSSRIANSRRIDNSRVFLFRIRFPIVRCQESKLIWVGLPPPAGAGHTSFVGEPCQRLVDVLGPMSNRAPNRPNRHRNTCIRQTPHNVVVDSLCPALTMGAGQAHVTVLVEHDCRRRHVFADPNLGAYGSLSAPSRQENRVIDRPENRLRAENFLAVGAAALALMVRKHHRRVASSRNGDQWIKCLYHRCVVRGVSHAEQSKQGVYDHEPRGHLVNVVYESGHSVARWRRVEDELDRFAPLSSTQRSRS